MTWQVQMLRYCWGMTKIYTSADTALHDWLRGIQRNQVIPEHDNINQSASPGGGQNWG